MNHPFTLGFSSCPNDTYLFDALIHHRIDTGGLKFNSVMADVEQLNEMAYNQELDITKMSFHAYFHVSQHYQATMTGCALGRGNGPIIVSKSKIYPDELKHIVVAIPGKFTTAALLLYIAAQHKTKTLPYLFSDIPDVVLSGEAEAGILIHETRFTYQKKGLKKIIDLGEFWEKKTDLPLPLGCIAVRRNLEEMQKITINRLIRESLLFAMAHPETSNEFIISNAQEKDDKVIKQHITTFVNDYTLKIGNEGIQAVEKLFSLAQPYVVNIDLKKPIFTGD